MSDEFAAKKNCNISGAPYLAFDGLTDDALCFEYLVSSADTHIEQFSSSECKDFYVQGGDGRRVVSAFDICSIKNNADNHSRLMFRLSHIKANAFSPEMHALSEALVPITMAAAVVREQDSNKWKRFDDLNRSIVTAKMALCIEDGYKKTLEDDADEYVAAAYKQCREEDAGWWKNLLAGITGWDGNIFKSLFMSVEEAEKNISTAMRGLQIKEDEQELLLMMYLPNILKELYERQVTEEKLLSKSKTEAQSPLKALPPCDIQLIAYFKSVVPTLSYSMKFGEATVSQYTGSADFLEQSIAVLGSYEVDLAVAAQHIEDALALEDHNDAIVKARQAWEILIGIPKLGDPTKLNEAISLLNPPLWKAAMIKSNLSKAAKSVEDYAEMIETENANDMSAAINAMTFIIDLFAKKAERREFGKVLLATLWMNAAVDATDSVRRGNAIARARDLLKQVSLCKSGEPCNLSAAERRWFEHINRLLGLLSSVKGNNLGCLEGQVQENNQCWDTAESCMSRVPSEAFDASSRMCVPCESDQRVKVTAKDAKGRATETACAKKSIHIVTVQNADTSNDDPAKQTINCDISPNQKMKLDQDPEMKKAYDAACKPK